jgi:hypothetical protein|tara:strand:+ start:11633 stop:11881 length:249 start_codon:yes stop_codon:yes gene_type:complete
MTNLEEKIKKEYKDNPYHLLNMYNDLRQNLFSKFGKRMLRIEDDIKKLQKVFSNDLPHMQEDINDLKVSINNLIKNNEKRTD